MNEQKNKKRTNEQTNKTAAVLWLLQTATDVYSSGFSPSIHRVSYFVQHLIFFPPLYIPLNPGQEIRTSIS